MAIDRLVLKEFSAIEAADLRFASGINVLLGPNATGKTHVMKVLYASLQAAANSPSRVPLRLRLEEKLAGVFQPDDRAIGRLVHRRRGQRSAHVTVHTGRKSQLAYSIATKTSTVKVASEDLQQPPSCIFLPSREVLSLFEGFIAAYKERELSFDETYFDLAVALSAKGIRGTKPAVIAEVLALLEGEVGGKVILDGPRFYVQSGTGTKIEAHLLSEGMRKIASIIRLLANNGIREKGVLFWDEPEANLNPRLAVVVAKVLSTLAKQGIQIFVATHDYLISETLALLDGGKGASDVRFFNFDRDPEEPEKVAIETADALDDLSRNAIRDEFLAHYDRVREVE